MSDDDRPTGSDDSSFDDVLAKYLNQRDEDGDVDQEAFIAEHQQYADELRSFFLDDVRGQRLHRLGSTMGQTRSTSNYPFLSLIRRFGNYELLNPIGEGGMGTVYLARDLSLDRRVAVKFIVSGRLASEIHIERFQLEAKMAAALQHPNIVSIHEMGQHEGHWYFSMDYIEGPNLREVVNEHPLDSVRAAHVMAKVAQAVHFAHQNNVLHRDLKPSNIIIDAAGEPHVTDFGLAKRTDPDDRDRKTSGAPVGTPNYMPPEQANPRFGRVDRQSDVYAIGATLFHLLTNRPPFTGAYSPDILRQVCEREPVSLRMLNDTVPRDLETICLKCLQKEPHKRYISAEALADDLQRFIRREPIIAKPISRFARAYRWARREPTKAALLAVTILLAVFGPMVAVLQYRLLAENRRLLSEQRRMLAQQHVQTARVHAESGAWPDVIENLNAAEAAGFDDEVQLAFLKYTALERSLQTEASLQLLKKLVERDDLGDFTGPVLLSWGLYLLSRAQIDDGEHAIAKAVDAGLDDADQALARALLAPSVPQVLSELRQSIALRPYRPQTHGALIIALVIAGYMDEARLRAETASARWPADPGFVFVKALIGSLQLDGEYRDTALEESAGALSETHLGLIREACEDVEHVATSFHNMDMRPNARDILRLIRALQRLQEASGDAQGIRLPPLVYREFQKLPIIYARLIFPLTKEAAASDLEEVTKRLPIAPLQLSLAYARMPTDPFSHPVAWRKAKEAYVAAAQAPSPFPGIRKAALYGAAMSEAVLARLHDAPEEKSNAIEHLQHRLFLGPVDAFKGQAMVPMAISVGQYSAALRLVDDVEADDPDCNAVASLRADIHFKMGNYSHAIRFADQAIAVGHLPEAATRIRDQAIDKLKGVLDAVGNAPANPST